MAASSPLAEPFRIGGVEIPNRVVLAPMAGVTNGAYRRHYRRHGAGLVYSEMVSAYGLLHGNRRTQDYVTFDPGERPIGVQLFGDDPAVLARAAEILLDGSAVPDLLDLNLGCPVRKVVKTGAGCGLAADRGRARACLQAMVEVSAPRGVPVTAKIRSGPAPGMVTAVDLARDLEAAGAAAVCVHPRAQSQLYRGSADHAVTAAVVEALTVPVIASGDVCTAEGALEIYESTGAAAVMVARGGQGNPWLLRDLLEGGDRERPGLEAVVRDLLDLLDEAEADLGPDRANRWIRKHLSWYLRPSGIPGEAVDRLRRSQTVDLLREDLARLVNPSV